MNTSLTRKPALIASAVIASFALAACGSSDPSTVSSGGNHAAQAAPGTSVSYGPPATGPHNAQDVTFVKDMLPHHTQAVEMADMALTRTTTPEVKALARQIKGAQAPEISAMGGWLTGWGEPLPAAGSMGGSMGGMSGGTGMMDAGQMTSLDKATGTEFAKRWLTDMTEHHTGAVSMARTETASGQNAEAKKLATDIVTSQTAEIATMERLLSGLA